MVLYKCLTCFREFKKKSHYITHTEHKKNPCKPPEVNKHNEKAELFQNIPDDSKIFQNIPNNSKIFQNIPEKNPIFTINDKKDILDEENEDDKNLCKYCFKQFSTVFNLNKHVKNSCKVKKLDEEKKDLIFNRLIENENKMSEMFDNFKNLQKNYDNIQKNYNNIFKENEKLKQHIKDLEHKYNSDIKKIVNKNTNNTNNSNNTINNTNNNNLNIIIPNEKLVNFGKEDLSKIPYDDIIKACTGSNVTGYHVLIELIKQIHFNDKFPEFQNVYMTDRNREKYMFWQNAWQLGDNNIFTEIMSQPQELLSTHEEKLQKDIDKNKITAKKISNVVDKYYDCENGFNDVVDPKVKDLVYNNKDKIRNNYKKLLKEKEIDGIKQIEE